MLNSYTTPITTTAATRITMMVLLVLMLASSLTACAKRGEPYRPSNIPEATSS